MLLVISSRPLINLLVIKFIRFTASQTVIIIWPYIVHGRSQRQQGLWQSLLIPIYPPALAILWANNGTTDTYDRKGHAPVHAEDRVAIVHEVHIHFLYVLVLHHAEGEEIHTWKTPIFIQLTIVHWGLGDSGEIRHMTSHFFCCCSTWYVGSSWPLFLWVSLYLLSPSNCFTYYWDVLSA